MADPRDPTALVRHAIEAGDWRLAALILSFLDGEPRAALGTAGRAYLALCHELGLVAHRC